MSPGYITCTDKNTESLFIPMDFTLWTLVVTLTQESSFKIGVLVHGLVIKTTVFMLANIWGFACHFFSFNMMIMTLYHMYGVWSSMIHIGIYVKVSHGILMTSYMLLCAYIACCLIHCPTELSLPYSHTARPLLKWRQVRVSHGQWGEICMQPVVLDMLEITSTCW